MSGEKKLNPQVRSITVGIRDLREIKIYPLSIADQLEMTDLITGALEGFFVSEERDNLAFVTTIVNLVKENIAKIIELATCKEQDPQIVLKEMTNDQLGQFANVVYDMNFEGLVKNVQSLLEKIEGAPLDLEKSSPQSANDMDTDLRMSIDEPSETED